jgi:hypothetical protein
MYEQLFHDKLKFVEEIKIVFPEKNIAGKFFWKVPGKTHYFFLRLVVV